MSIKIVKIKGPNYKKIKLLTGVSKTRQTESSTKTIFFNPLHFESNGLDVIVTIPEIALNNIGYLLVIIPATGTTQGTDLKCTCVQISVRTESECERKK